MPRPQLHRDTLAPVCVPGRAHTRYLVVRHNDVWLIKFDGEEYGPYQTEREAMLLYARTKVIASPRPGRA